MKNIINLWSGSAELNPEQIPDNRDIQVQIIQRPDEYRFLHDCMIEFFHGKLYTAWYNCPIGEMADRSVIRGRVSSDNGKSWGPIQMMAEDPTDQFIYVPPAFGVCPVTDSLYLFASRMTGPDLVHDLDLFQLQESDGSWKFIRRITEPFLPNTQIQKLPNGKLIVGGRLSPVMDSYPEIPAVAISDSGKIDAPWRIVKIQDKVKAPDGNNPLPETALLLDGMNITAFVRNNNGYPLMYESQDGGETWSEPLEHNLPAGSSKLAAGLLSNRQRYLICNIEGQQRNTLALFLSAPGEKTFSEVSLIRNGTDEALQATPEWSYPAAIEYQNELLIVCTSGKTSATFIRYPLKNC